MSSSSPSSSNSLPGSRKRPAKAMGGEIVEGWMPKIRIINFDPSRKTIEKSTKTISATLDPEQAPPKIIVKSGYRQNATDPNGLPSTSPLPETSLPPNPAAIAPHIELSQSPFVPHVLIFNSVPVSPSDPLYPLLICAKFCENCHTAETSYWRTDDDGKDHCNPCGLHWTKHRSPRPIDPNQEAASGKLTNLACQICPTRKQARRREEFRGIILCNACTDYWKRNHAVRPLIAFAKRPKADRGKEPGMIRQTKKCANCGTGRSSKWMIGPAGEDNCSECGLFWMYHKMRRPLGVGVGVDAIGPKRETRGPRIMDSRKRRLGSVNTGSGSDSECGMETEDSVRKTRRSSTIKQEDQEIEILTETSSTPDDSPAPLLTLAILSRKVQLHLRELSFLNSPLLSRPSISSLRSVIDSIINELSPLPHRRLSAFTRSTIARGVLRNLLAHVTAAESDSLTSENERFQVVKNDYDFGPEDVGDSFYVGNALENESIDAAKGLMDLHKVDSHGSTGEMSNCGEENCFRDYEKCQNEIVESLRKVTKSGPPQLTDDVDGGADEELWTIGLLSINCSPTILVKGPVHADAKSQIISIAKKYNYSVAFENEREGAHVDVMTEGRF